MSREVLAYLSIGSNMGNKLYYIVSALKEIHGIPEVSLTQISSFYETEPWGVKDQDSFYNIAVEIRTTLLPFELLRKLQEIETRLDRVRKLKWGPRTVDIDIIFYDDLKIDTEELNIPHPRYRDRKFVLKPLYEIFLRKEYLLKYMERDMSDISKITPKILISSCLLGKNCNYKGKNNLDKFFLKLGKRVEYLPVCPEVLGGMPVPRTPAERIGEKVVTKTGEDVTEKFVEGAEKALEICEEKLCKLAVMKSKSPSCGYGKIYNGHFSGVLKDGNGVTVDLLLKKEIDVISV